ncbi:MAG: tRNA pseudouridine(55) synthase TruB [Actinomycetota bacterium]|jgi:tRNA pseudouridine55 synthase
MARRKPPQIHGFMIIDKPAGCTSHDVVDRIRRRLGERRVGHAGTLDPDATGVLLVGVGSATRLVRFMDLVNRNGVMTTEKSYTGEVVLGAETASLDASGEVTATHDMNDLISRLEGPDGVAHVQSVVDANLVGSILQVPPMVSAIRIDGKRLHELAREGIEVEREARPVVVSRFAVTGISRNVVSIDVTCSSGTFIRSLAADLGRLLGGGAHLRNLRRTAVGAYSVADAASIDEAPLRPVVEAVRGLSALVVTGDEASDLRAATSLGKVLPRERFVGIGPEPWAVIADGQLLAIYESFSNAKIGDSMARPAVNLAADSGTT